MLKPFQKHLPRGTRIIVRGQVETMQSSFIGLGIGLVMAICAGVLPDRGELSVVARSVHHHHRAAGSAGRNLLDAAADAYHA